MRTYNVVLTELNESEDRCAVIRGLSRDEAERVRLHYLIEGVYFDAYIEPVELHDEHVAEFVPF